MNRIILEDIYDTIKQVYSISDSHRNRYIQILKNKLFNIFDYYEEYLNQDYVKELKNKEFIIFNKETLTYEIDINYKNLIKELK